MGTVWRAVQQSTRREVALKLLKDIGFTSGTARIRFEREVELAARLEHPHIARVYDSGVRSGVYFYAMELVDGLPLDVYVAEQHLDTAQILKLVRMIAKAVEHAHQRGVIHRDLKPSNILVTKDGQPHVLDFGLAKALLVEKPGMTISLEGDVAGTPAYMSPEQAAGKVDQIDTRSDVYSLGVILYHLLMRTFPHDLSGRQYEVLKRLAEEEPRRPREVSRKIDKELEALLLKTLAHEAEARYASAGDLAKDIANYLSGEPVDAQAPTMAYFLWKRLRKHRLPVALGVGALVALLSMVLVSGIKLAAMRVTNRTLDEKVDKLEKDLSAAEARLAAEFPPGMVLKSNVQGKVTELETKLAAAPSAVDPAEEANANEVLDAAKQFEQKPGAGLLDKAAAYQNVIRVYPNSKAAAEAKNAVDRLIGIPDSPDPATPAEPTAAEGDSITVKAAQASLHGAGIRYEPEADRDDIGYWGKENDYVVWTVRAAKAGTFTVAVTYAAEAACEGNEYSVAVADQQLGGKVRSTGDRKTFKTEPLGQIKLVKVGDFQIVVRTKGKPKGPGLMSLRAVALKLAVPQPVADREADAQEMLKSARIFEANPGAFIGDKLEAYRSVVKDFAGTKAAEEARKALERLAGNPG
jgi:hypothetical protein